jgi:hypothetical protein
MWKTISELVNFILTANRSLYNTPLRGNAEAKAAFARLNNSESSFGEWAKNSEGGMHHFQLLVGTDDIIAPYLNIQMLTVFVNEIYRRVRGGEGDYGQADIDGNLWEALSSIFREFKLTFVPAVEYDGLVPFTPMLSEVWRTIYANEYSDVQQAFALTSHDHTYITQVGVHAQSYMGIEWRDDSTVQRILGTAVVEMPTNNNREFSGRLLMVKAPTWMHPPMPEGAMSTLPGQAIPDLANPAIGEPIKDEQNKIDTAALQLKLGSRYAKTILMEQLFASRSMSITGRLRFDIAPGSILEVEVLGDKFSSGIGETPEAARSMIYGAASQVEIEIGGRMGAFVARTTIVLSHVHSEAEHKTYAVKAHPLYMYDKPYVGAPLLENMWDTEED